MKIVSKEKAITTLKYTWPIYVGLLAISVIGWHYAFSIKHAPKDYETLGLFLSGEVKSTDFIDEIKEEFSDDGVKKVDSYSCPKEEAIYFQKLTVVGYTSADVLIIPESIAKNLVVSAFALELDEDVIKTFDFTPTYYVDEEQNYGILVSNSMFKDEVVFSNENNYLFINASSANIEGEHTNAFKLVNYLMNL